MQHRLRNFLLALGVAFFIYFNFFSSLVIIPTYLYSLGGTEFQAGLQNSVFFIVGILLRFYFGPLADTRGRKLPILIGAFIFATTPLLFLLATSVPLIFLVRLYQAIGLAAFFSSATSLISDIAPVGKMGTYMGSYRVVATLGILIGPSISISLIQTFDYPVYFVISSLIGLMALILGLFLIPPVLTGVHHSSSPLAQIKVVLMNQHLWLIYLGAGVVALTYGTLLSFGALYFDRATDVANPGLYFTIFAFVGMLANLSAGALSDRLGRREIIIPSLCILGLGISMLYYLPGNPFILWSSSILAGLGYGGAFTTLFTWLADVTDQTMRATALAFQENAIDISYASGSFFFGISLSLFNYPLSFSLLGMFAVLVAALFFMSGRAEKKRGDEQSQVILKHIG